MTFLTTEDYTVVIRNEIKNVVASDPAQLALSEQFAMSEMESYLSGRFDVAMIFSAVGSDRNQSVVMYLVDMVLYHLHSNIAPRNIPELRKDRYEAAINWLKMVNRGELTPKLPYLPDDKAIPLFTAGHNEKTSKRW
jgi:phage gp36-like protein